MHTTSELKNLLPSLWRTVVQVAFTRALQPRVLPQNFVVLSVASSARRWKFAQSFSTDALDSTSRMDGSGSQMQFVQLLPLCELLLRSLNDECAIQNR